MVDHAGHDDKKNEGKLAQVADALCPGHSATTRGGGWQWAEQPL
jgi:hypothetical protein